jgi:hypothetical protein
MQSKLEPNIYKNRVNMSGHWLQTKNINFTETITNPIRHITVSILHPFRIKFLMKSFEI